MASKIIKALRRVDTCLIASAGERLANAGLNNGVAKADIVQVRAGSGSVLRASA